MRSGFVRFASGGKGFAIITKYHRIVRRKPRERAKMFAGFGGAALPQQRHAEIPLAIGKGRRDADGLEK